jgi:site-specific DNA recombinase
MRRTSVKNPKATTKSVRCAIYTRKSTEEGLDQDFNTLDAQREAAESYIKSQKHEGWECLAENYDDGGFSGGNLDRPALRRLMADIETGKIDCVVVYKVDRLSRSLLDFARIMEIFERHRVAFVSVTQQFNTATSMGRLVLNVLLSFAQFEREIIGERIRDKIAAQRRKGKWSGGTPVLGYEVDRSNRSPKLVVSRDEAKRVAKIFDLYLELGSMFPVLQDLEARGWLNKTWTTSKGVVRGGRPFDKSSLYALLTNPIYIGKIRHKSAMYTGEHEPIVKPEVFEAVQARLRKNGRTAGSEIRSRHTTLLRGLLYCKACGRVMVHTFTDKGPKRYRYYTCTLAIHGGRGKCPSGSLPAAEIERLVVDQVQRISTDPALRAEVLRQAQAHVDAELTSRTQEQRNLQRELKSLHADVNRLAGSGQSPDVKAEKSADLLAKIAQCENQLADCRQAVERLDAERISAADIEAVFADFPSLWDTLAPREQRELLHNLVARVEFNAAAESIAISFHAVGIKSLAVAQRDEAA